jgi:hypothetical protein
VEGGGSHRRVARFCELCDRRQCCGVATICESPQQFYLPVGGQGREAGREAGGRRLALHAKANLLVGDGPLLDVVRVDELVETG